MPTKLDVLEMNDAFLLQFKTRTYISKPYPEGVKYLGSIDYAVQPLQPEDLEEFKRIQMGLISNSDAEPKEF